jgi:8-oxo-dGTP pyrophosphatase MutT (NUDIX family)
MESGVVKAVGVWFYSTSTDRYLYLLRQDNKYPGSWGLPGGKAKSNESLLAALSRECQEEIGSMPVSVKLIPLEMFTSADEQFQYHTFFAAIDEEFIPRLNHEHIGYAWIDSETWPRPMHPGLWNTINIDAIQEKIAKVKETFQMSQ